MIAWQQLVAELLQRLMELPWCVRNQYHQAVLQNHLRQQALKFQAPQFAQALRQSRLYLLHRETKKLLFVRLA